MGLKLSAIFALTIDEGFLCQCGIHHTLHAKQVRDFAQLRIGLVRFAEEHSQAPWKEPLMVEVANWFLK